MSIIGDIAAPYALIYSNVRQIDTIIPDVVVEEQHHDGSFITLHPVETGAPISDHAYRLPAEVEMRCGWSDSNHQEPGFVQQVYDELLALKNLYEPFNVSTGKRLYQNMLIKDLAVTTDDKYEFALNCIVGLREIIIASTSGGGGTGQGGVGAQADQASPQQTAAATNMGTQNLAPVTSGPLSNTGLPSPLSFSL